MVPSDDHLRSTGLLEHVKHIRLKDRVYGLDTDSRAVLRVAGDINRDDSDERAWSEMRVADVDATGGVAQCHVSCSDG